MNAVLMEKKTLTFTFASCYFLLFSLFFQKKKNYKDKQL